MRCNGVEIPLENPRNLQDFLVEQGFDWKRIAVERNGEIVPRTTYEKVSIDDSDTLEVVGFMGGG